jgi:D-alanyl-D-alanine carboxypeptidase
MTAGIYDFTMDEAFDADFTRDPLLPFTPEDVIAIVKRHDPDFAPGARVQYSDTKYTFLGVILEKVTGKTVEQVIQEQCSR